MPDPIDPTGAPAGNSPATNSDPIMSGQIGFDANSLIPDDLKGEASLDNLKLAKSSEEFIGSLTKGFVNAQKLIGQQKTGVQVPGENATDDERNQFFRQLGRPEESSGYGLHEDMLTKRQQVLPDDKYVKMREKAFQLGMTKHQGEEWIKWSIDQLVDLDVDRDAIKAVDNVQSMDKLRESWGVKTDNNVNIANEAVHVAFQEDGDLMSRLSSAGALSNPTFIKFMHGWGAQTFEDAIKQGAGGTTAGFSGRAAAQQEINALNSDPAFQADLWNKNGHQRQKAAQARQTGLFNRIYK